LDGAAGPWGIGKRRKMDEEATTVNAEVRKTPQAILESP
jgi:hypothetical protein